ncbi:helix-turn-helix transcriptional regulator [Mycolicibacterium parafortuitum]|uniref:LuxR family transcriptional regulator [Cellvibrio japonicus Ueda107] n=1 Tax=Mycolicibacterium parafortuitum TaxID=39692 RepID=A0A375YFI8_MYCPF|nr:LuxR C-terminal-related transcriptional regulator [Mycolicibacterium parafortuitum]ORB31390.1 helix-turn-helix transcriptional regulator [Mycolicibacterium parafortuitum]SRX79862.1 LuxR family transcriptional regulator [Cellvibrio japonicus Ueda107] [Mycolicibacterium parafortuitum]
MVAIEQFSQMVTAMHSAAVEPDRWVDALTVVRTALDANATGLVLTDGPRRAVRSCSFTDSEAMAAYDEYYGRFDYVLEAVERSAPGLVHNGKTLVALNPRSEFHGEWMCPYALDDGAFVRVSAGPKTVSFVVAGKRAEPFATTDNMRLVNALVPQLQRALRTEHLLTELRDRAALRTHPADAVGAPAMTVAADMTLTYTNTAAESLLRCSAEVLTRSGHLYLSSPASDTDLRRAVSRAARETGPRIADTLRVARRTSPRPLIVHVMPAGATAAQPGALVIVVDPDVHREPPKQLLRRLFSLTDSEAEVALRIGRGQALAAVADELILSLATVKTHLQHVYQKTDTHRQGELVRLLLSLMP